MGRLYNISELFKWFAADLLGQSSIHANFSNTRCTYGQVLDLCVCPPLLNRRFSRLTSNRARLQAVELVWKIQRFLKFCWFYFYIETLWIQHSFGIGKLPLSNQNKTASCDAADCAED